MEIINLENSNWKTAAVVESNLLKCDCRNSRWSLGDDRWCPVVSPLRSGGRAAVTLLCGLETVLRDAANLLALAHVDEPSWWSWTDCVTSVGSRYGLVLLVEILILVKEKQKSHCPLLVHLLISLTSKRLFCCWSVSLPDRINIPDWLDAILWLKDFIFSSVFRERICELHLSAIGRVSKNVALPFKE